MSIYLVGLTSLKLQPDETLILSMLYEVRFKQGNRLTLEKLILAESR
jgi:hypothetical protein